MRGRAVLIAAGLVAMAVAARFAFVHPEPPTAHAARAESTTTSADPQSTAEQPAPTTRPTNAAVEPSTAAAKQSPPAQPIDHGNEEIDSGRPRRVRAADLPTETLVQQLASTDDFAVLEAANELANRKAARAIKDLATIDIKKGPRAAPSIIDALGRLAAADPGTRRTATDRLLELLAQERTRNAPESAGNVLALYAALGQTLDPRAAPALEAELLDPKVTSAAKTVVVDALVQLKQSSSSTALRTLQRDLAGQVPQDKMEAEIQRELATAIERALRTMP